MLSSRVRTRWKQGWSAALLLWLGIRVRHTGQLPSGPLLLVANHVSWLDIFLINAVVPVVFVSKAEVRQWPLFGWFAAQNQTIFLERGVRGQASVIGKAVAEALSGGQIVALFPEGTTSLGNVLLPFHGALLQPALSAGAVVSPVAIQYIEGEEPPPSSSAAYIGEMSLWQSLWKVAGAQGLEAHLTLLPALSGNDRKALAREARTAIGLKLGITLPD